MLPMIARMRVRQRQQERNTNGVYSNDNRIDGPERVTKHGQEESQEESEEEGSSEEEGGGEEGKEEGRQEEDEEEGCQAQKEVRPLSN